ncbi:hypothetical protein D3C71_1609480 [compost metagenome]
MSTSITEWKCSLEVVNASSTPVAITAARPFTVLNQAEANGPSIGLMLPVESINTGSTAIG